MECEGWASPVFGKAGLILERLSSFFSPSAGPSFYNLTGMSVLPSAYICVYTVI